MIKPMFQIGQEVEVRMIGTVEGIEMDEKGKPYYRVVYRFDNTPKSDMAFCHEDSLSELPEPKDFIGGTD